jgi:hypothetical protein
MSNHEYFYPGTPSSMEPGYSELFGGYQFPAGRLSLTTNIQNANQLAEVSNLLNQGVKHVEMSLVHKNIFDQIPKHHLKEIARLAKLTGSKISMHAPFVDMADLGGFQGENGQAWSEEQRQSVEREMAEIVRRGNEINLDGNVNITIHPSNKLRASSYHMEKHDGKDVKVMDTYAAYNIINDQVAYIPPEESYDPLGNGSVESISPKERIEKYNQDFWKEKLRELRINAGKANEYLIDSEGVRVAQKDLNTDDPTISMFLDRSKMGVAYLDGVEKELRTLYANAMKVAKETENKRAQEVLQKAHNEYSKKVREIEQKGSDYINSVSLKGEAVNVLLKNMENLAEKDVAPQIFIDADEFAIKQTSKTLSNVALSAYNKYKETAPTLSIENPPYGLSMASGEELAKLIVSSRDKLTQSLVAKEGLSSDKARKVAEKMIGVTWDTAHISGMKNHGFSESHLVEESKKVSPFVKHVHMNDSLGGQMHGDLPPGMGDVPIDKIMGEFASKGFAGTAVFESGAFASMHKITPHPFVLEAMGSPLYAAKAGPNWNRFAQSGNESIYYSGMGTTIPDNSFQMYGAGFTSLPTELGGQQAGRGTGSRFSGTPMA